MFGFCQGSFCRSKIATIISEQLNMPLYKVLQNAPKTEYGLGDIKVLQKKNGKDTDE
jgi:glycerol-3-phosphate dehydrogenase